VMCPPRSPSRERRTRRRGRATRRRAGGAVALRPVGSGRETEGSTRDASLTAPHGRALLDESALPFAGVVGRAQRTAELLLAPVRGFDREVAQLAHAAPRRLVRARRATRDCAVR